MMIFILEIGKIIIKKVKEYLNIIMEIYLKDILKIIKEKIEYFIQMKKIIY